MTRLSKKMKAQQQAQKDWLDSLSGPELIMYQLTMFSFLVSMVYGVYGWSSRNTITLHNENKRTT